ncbi:family 20 glycosylhydrolase [Mucilaginibacter aquaedulcis]|uniref:family 20 glycosylhydrolase n=1 Tax=Mucilaginibacter aquaedulcis TaxID=1187081 RepID=UPI0025B446D8|nr:family 20 glycosylhydrolase [Mucilaginibacter aquaedulcis]MDN3546811.1 family 20 glycosylhydrolase [Mucilaginibacter aquaedulcis]
MYKKASLLLLALLTVSSNLLKAQDSDPNLGIIPVPVSVKKAPGQFTLSQETIIQADSPSNKAVLFFKDFLTNNLAYNKAIVAKGGANNNVVTLTSAGTENLPAEGYRLTITPQQVTVAGKGAGLFYGIQTLLQLIPLERGATSKLPCVQVEDYPRFGYRGAMLDVGRHFFSVEMVKKYIDLLAAYKLNNFHWHLTEDQGWRIEIKKYPKLTQIGSMRAQTLIGGYRDRTPQQFDNTPYGGFYTQDQIRDVVKYATARYINVVPEIEMPGHSSAALAAYPELGCEPGKAYKAAETWGVFKDIYCPTEKTFSFLEDVLTEVMELFPSKYIHIGGDEAPKDAWKNSAYCQQLIKKLKLKDEHGLQSYFIQRMEKFLNSKGRSIIGWDEILEGGLAPNATVMSWRGEEGGIAAAQQKHKVIMTPGSNGLYIDHGQGKPSQEPLSIGGNEPLSKIYSYNPTPDVLTADEQKYIEGVQANLWTEYIPTDAKVEYMLLPRLMALSEVAWSPLANKNFKDFSETRLPGHLAWLDKNGFNYRVPTAIGAKDTVMIGSQLTATLKPSVDGAKVYYTIDGYSPRETDLIYNIPLSFPVPQDQYRELQTIVITPSGKRSVATRMVVYNKAPLAAVSNYTASAPGVKYQLFPGTFTATSQLSNVTATDSGAIKTFSTADFRKNKGKYGVVYSGYINAEADGNYGFSTLSGNGAVLLIDDQVVVDNDGKHAVTEQDGAVPLMKGYHRFSLKYVDAGGPVALKVFINAPGKQKAELTADTLYN